MKRREVAGCWFGAVVIGFAIGYILCAMVANNTEKAPCTHEWSPFHLIDRHIVVDRKEKRLFVTFEKSCHLCDSSHKVTQPGLAKAVQVIEKDMYK
jgi:hypothetical protein